MNVGMDDEDDTYGFGSFTDLFDGAASSSHAASASTATALSASASPATVVPLTPAKLDVRAMSDLWVSERALADFVQQRKRHCSSISGDSHDTNVSIAVDALAAREFQHVAAKFNGVTVDGGLGTAYCVQSFDGTAARRGLLWVQTRQSESNVQEKRKKELQDITNQRSSSDRASHTSDGSAKSPSAVLICASEIAAVSATRIQNAVPGLALTLHSGRHFELAFMPGPFAKPSDRDELLAAVRAAMAQSSARVDPQTPKSQTSKTRTPTRALNSSASKASPRVVDTTRSDHIYIVPRHLSPLRPSSLPPRPKTTPEERVRETQVAVRVMVRKYLALDARSDEAIQLARNVHALSGYRLGPMAKSFPQFAADAAHRKKSIRQLADVLERMNRDWKDAELDRERSTHARAVRNQRDEFEYTHVDTGARIPAHEYEETYLRHIEADRVDPVLRLLPVRAAPPVVSAPAQAPPNAKQPAQSIAVAPTSPTPAATLSNAERMRALSALVGFDISQSCILDTAFYERARCNALVEDDDARLTDLPIHSRTALRDARADMWKSWGAALALYTERRQRVVLDAMRTMSPARVAAAVRMIPPPPVPFVLPRAASALSATPVRDEISADLRRRGRDRRRSLVEPSAALQELRDGSVEAAVAIAEAEAEAARRTASVASVRASTKRRRSSDSADAQHVTVHRKARRQSIVGSVQFAVSSNDENTVPCIATAICELCYNARACVQMEPCGHAVCATCWTRLGSGESEQGVGARVCPWDREVVTQRSM